MSLRASAWRLAASLTPEYRSVLCSDWVGWGFRVRHVRGGGLFSQAVLVLEGTGETGGR